MKVKEKIVSKNISHRRLKDIMEEQRAEGFELDNIEECIKLTFLKSEKDEVYD